MIDLDWIQRLIDMVDESDIDALEISRFATRVRISKSPPVHVVAGGSAGPASAATAVEAPAAPPQSDRPAGSADPPSDAPPADSKLVEVESPMVGTFYRAPAPDAPAYVEVGDRVQKGQTLCILEAMKLMNELEAEVAGTVREISIGNGEPVEYGQVLFRIEPD
ncbi:MAG: acetyl-CoA carboxylase biotin carboxyl carrier protein [Gemmatimonadota bacterium]